MGRPSDAERGYDREVNLEMLRSLPAGDGYSVLRAYLLEAGMDNYVAAEERPFREGVTERVKVRGSWRTRQRRYTDEEKAAVLRAGAERRAGADAMAATMRASIETTLGGPIIFTDSD